MATHRLRVQIGTFLVVLAALLALFPSLASADADSPVELAESTTVFFESDTGTPSPLSLSAAMRAHAEGHFKPAGMFGIDSRPFWIARTFVNHSASPQAVRLAVGATWTDEMEVYVTHSGQLTHTWRAGDEVIGTDSVQPGVGFVFPFEAQAGKSQLFVRVASDDPLFVPISIETIHQAEATNIRRHVTYGMFYGFLGAMTLYAALVWLKLGMRAYLFYGLYLLSFVVLSIGSNGYGQRFWWPDNVMWQRYVNHAGVIFFSQCGLRFALHFFNLAELSPRLKRAVDAFNLIALTGLFLFILADWQRAASIWQLVVMLISNVVMIGLGRYAIQLGPGVGRYYWGGVVCSASCSALSSLSALSILPISFFHAIEFGVAIEAYLLAFALAIQLRNRDLAGQRAMLDALHDPLTQLSNRRAFYEMGASPWYTAQRSRHEISLLVIDVDHFKSINDTYGHAAGDEVLKNLATLLANCSRAGDIVARWGGEEFVIMLPETDQASALGFAKRLLFEAQDMSIAALNEKRITVSIGVATRSQEQTIDALIAKADEALYRAKSGGRNRVEVAESSGVK